MELIIDLHVHSHYSRATSRDCTLEGLYRWGKTKGINIIGTGDFTHPDWHQEISNKLELADGGLYKLRSDIAAAVDKELPPSVRNQLLLFVPTAEISTIYSKNGSVRKIHQLITAPSLETAAVLNKQLAGIGNLRSDGRPILGLDSKELLRLCQETNPELLYIPAHIWTPWFGLFGSKSGFDSLEEAYEELAPEVKAVETGLSADPAMNWRLSQLDNLTITSYSDAHSPGKLGREATVVKSQASYDEIRGALKSNDQRLIGTVEFFPQEGKYHYDGHRACGVRTAPVETKKLGGLCPKCGRPLTVGVDSRVDELADRTPEQTPSPKRVEYIVPLPELLAELAGAGPASKRVQGRYHQVIAALGNEFSILRNLPESQIAQAGFADLAAAIRRLRTSKVIVDPGYDGVYGTVRIYKNPPMVQSKADQQALF